MTRWCRTRIGPHPSRVVVSLAVAAVSLTVAGAAQAGGTHVVLQLQGGFATSPADDMGLTLGYGFVGGYGGRVRNTFLRVYGIVTFDRASFTGSGENAQSGVAWTAERAYNDLQVGLRLLIPVFYRLRWYFEGLIGGSYLTGSLSPIGGRELASNRWSGLLTATTGLEVRYHEHVATGVRAELRWLFGGGEVLPIDMGQDRADDFRIVVLATQSFMF